LGNGEIKKLIVKANFLKIAVAVLALAALAGLSYFLTQAVKTNTISKSAIINSLYKDGILQKDFVLVGFSQVCNLKIDGQLYPVYDSREDENNASEPRGNNQIIVFNPHYQVVQHFDYVDARPLLCRDNSLYVLGDLSQSVAGANNGENTLIFSNEAKSFELKQTDILKLPEYDGQ